MIKKILFSLLICLISVLSFAQFATLKELEDYKHQLSVVKDDSSRVLMMAYLSLHYGIWNPDSSIIYGQKALALAKQIKYTKGEINALIGLARASMGDPNNALQYGLEALRKAEENNFLEEKAICFTELGDNFCELEGNPKEIDYYKQAKAIYESVGDKPELAYWKVLNKFFIINASYGENPGEADLREMEKLVDEEKKSHYWRLPLLRALAGMQFHLGKNELAIKNLTQVIQMAKEDANHYQLTESFNIMSKVYGELQITDSSIFYAERCLAESKFANQKYLAWESSRFLSEIYEPIDLKKALYYRKMYDSLNNTLYGAEAVKKLQKILTNEQQLQRNKEAAQVAYKSRMKQYALLSGLAILLIAGFFLYRNNRQKQKANAVLEKTLSDLKSTQSQLIQSEKMASLGELTAGIAHEIQNPLNFVNNFSEVNKEMIAELKEEIEKGNYDEVKIIANDIESNEEKINHHGMRADAIVKGMLQHSRQTSGTKEPTDINALCDEYLRLSYHGLRAKDKSFNANFETDFDASIEKTNIVQQDIGRVLLNLINNAFYAVSEKKKLSADSYQPLVSIKTRKVNDKIEIKITDNGGGIPDAIKEKIFQPFFTTKPTGSGTGLGLSLSYDIVKAHGGEIKVESQEGKGLSAEASAQSGTTFIIQIPIT